MSTRTLFHIAFPVDDLAAARRFYGEVLGCCEGRSSETWIDFDLYGHQIVAHLRQAGGSQQSITNQVDGHGVPVPHFGVILHIDEWTKLAERLRRAAVKFVIEPYTRFAGEPGEQATLFIKDPSGNALEFKGFRDLSQLFAT
jgi:extradiol dioxygenase family protein